MVTGAYVPDQSGAGLQCRALVQHLRATIPVAVLTTTTDSQLATEDEVDGVPVYRVFVEPSRVRSKLAAAVRMTRVMLRERRRFSILHLHGFSQKSMLVVALGLLMGKRIAIKLTSVGHDDPVSMQKQGGLAYWCYSRSHLYFGVSPRFQSLYEASELPAGRFRLIPNGVDLDRFRPAAPDERRATRRELGLPPDAAVVLFVGFFSREKCPDVLYDAWARAAQRGDTSSVLVFVGATRSTYYEVDQDLARDIRDRAAKAGLGGRLHFVEKTQEIEKYYRAADVFVLPSVREGLPNALLEAMASGTACVATRLEGVTDTLIDDGSSGVLIPPRDEAAIATALERLLLHPDQALGMGARARERVKRDFALTDVVQSYLDVYQELAAT
jgi:glycosyltransferase involved in cell wall biosynthesis